MRHEIEIPAEALTLYVQRRGNDLKKLKLALQNKISSDFCRVGHDLKGNAITFGFKDLEKLAKSIERAGLTENWDLAQLVLIEFENWYSRESKKLGIS